MISTENYTGRPINYSFHFGVILFLLVFQYFSVNLATFVRLNFFRHYYSAKDGGSGKFFFKGEYVPISSRVKIEPMDYEFVFVKEGEGTTKEIYFFKNGCSVESWYVGNDWKSSLITRGIILHVFLIVPMIGFVLFLTGVLRKSRRTKSIFTWQSIKHPYDRIEKICLLYGIPLFASGIILGNKVPELPIF